MDSAKHPALLLVDTISSLASIDCRHHDWKADVTVARSSKKSVVISRTFF